MTTVREVPPSLPGLSDDKVGRLIRQGEADERSGVNFAGIMFLAIISAVVVVAVLLLVARHHGA